MSIASWNKNYSCCSCFDSTTGECFFYCPFLLILFTIHARFLHYLSYLFIKNKFSCVASIEIRSIISVHVEYTYTEKPPEIQILQ